MGYKMRKIVFTKIVLIIFLGSFQNILSQSKKIDEINLSISYWENDYSYEDYISSNDRSICQSSLGYRGIIRGFTKIGVRKYDVVFFNVVNSEYGRVTIDYSDKSIPSEDEYKNYITENINSLKKDIESELIKIEKENLQKTLKLKREKEKIEFINNEKIKLTKIRDTIRNSIDDVVQYVRNLKQNIESFKSQIKNVNDVELQLNTEFRLYGGKIDYKGLNNSNLLGLKVNMIDNFFNGRLNRIALSEDSVSNYYLKKIKLFQESYKILDRYKEYSINEFIENHNDKSGGFYKNLESLFRYEISKLESEGFNYNYNNEMDKWDEGNDPYNLWVTHTEAANWWSEIFSDSSVYQKLINHPYFQEGDINTPIGFSDKITIDYEELIKFKLISQSIMDCFQWMNNDLIIYLNQKSNSLKRYENLREKCLNSKLNDNQRIIFDLLIKHSNFSSGLSSNYEKKSGRKIFDLKEVFNFYNELKKYKTPEFIIQGNGVQKLNFPIEKLNECLK